MFKFVKKESPEQNVSREYIDSVEKKYNIEFPNILRTYYMNYNMCESEEVTLVMHNLEFCVEFVLPLKYGTCSVESLLDLYRGDDHIPQHLVPFACDVDGDYYYWDINTGRVYYLTMGNIDNPIPIARSVDEFFELLNIYCD